MALAESLHSARLSKSHGSFAEEINLRVEQHGVGPLQPLPDDGPDRAHH
jgi:hypothetical protein